jgi:hypothetical protein
MKHCLQLLRLHKGRKKYLKCLEFVVTKVEEEDKSELEFGVTKVEEEDKSELELGVT